MIYQDWDLELTGEHIRINAMTEKDSETYGRLLLGNQLYDAYQEHCGKGELPTGFREVLDHTAEDEMHAIRFLSDDKLIGWITLQKNCDGEPDIGISLAESARNKGYGPEAVQLLGNYLHNAYGLRQLTARISAKNLQSQNAFAKIGAVLDRETPFERFARLMAEHPEHEIADGCRRRLCSSNSESTESAPRKNRGERFLSVRVRSGEWSCFRVSRCMKEMRKDAEKTQE